MWFCVPTACLALALPAPSSVQAASDAEQAYISALRDHGYTDLAIVYLERKLAHSNLSAAEKADAEFEIAALLADASRRIGDLLQREQALTAAARRFADFARRHPNHPRQGEALLETASVALQRGRLRILQAQLPSYQAQAAKFAGEGRLELRKASGEFDRAAKQISQERDKLPLPLEEERKNVPIRRERARLFNKIAESRFQHAYALFLAADSYRTVTQSASSDANDEFQKGVQEAEQAFAAVADDYRRWLIGPAAQVWRARCVAARGEHRKARGLFEDVLSNKDRRLGQVHRQAFFFQLLSLAQQKDHATVLARGEVWLRDHPRFRATPEGFGVQLELAKACVALAEQATVEAKRADHLRRANGYLEVVGKSANEYQGLARREQLKLEPLLAKDVPLREYQQFFSRATARIDALSPQATKEEKAETYGKAKELFAQSIEVAKPNDPVHQAKLMLAFAHFQLGEYAEAAEVAEKEARAAPRSPSAGQLFQIAMAALGLRFEQALQTRSGADAEVKRIEEFARFGMERLPDGNAADEARLSLGRLYAHPTRKDFTQAAELFKAVPEASSRYAEARSEIGRLYVEWSRQSPKEGNGAQEDAKAKRAEGLGYLREASDSLRKTKKGQLDRVAFATEGLLAELLLEKGEAQEAWTHAEPLAAAVERGSLPSSIDPALRLSAALTALQAAIQLGKFDVTDRLIEVVSRQQGQERADGVTQVFLMLAARMRDQLEKQQAAGDAAAGQKLEESYIAFLDRLAGREAGQTLNSLSFIGTAYVEIRRFDKAEPILDKAVEMAKQAPASEKPGVLRTKIAVAMCKSGLGKHEEAVNLIDALAEAEAQVQEVLVAKGRILMAADRLKEAERHWEKLVAGMIRQRPPFFYEAFHQLIETLLLQAANDETASTKAKKLLHAILDRPHASMTPAIRERLDRQLKRVESE